MNRFTWMTLTALLLTSLFVCRAWAEPTAEGEGENLKQKIADANRGLRALEEIVKATGVGVSPLLMMGASGAVHYSVTAPELRDRLPVFDQPWVWGAILALCVLSASRQLIGDFLGPFKILLELGSALGTPLVFALGLTYVTTTAAQSYPGEIQWGILLGLLSAFFYIAVWLTRTAFDILIALCPVPFVGTILGAIKACLLIILTALAYVHPLLGFAVAVPIIVVSLVLALRSARLLAFVGTYLWDYLRWRSTPVDAEKMVAFSGPATTGLPWFTRGRLDWSPEGLLVFRCRPWFWGPSRVIGLRPDNQSLGVGLVGLTISDFAPNARTAFWLPPRYRPFAVEVKQHLQLAGRHEGAIGLSLFGIVDLLRGFVGLSPRKPAATESARS